MYVDPSLNLVDHRLINNEKNGIAWDCFTRDHGAGALVDKGSSGLLLCQCGYRFSKIFIYLIDRCFKTTLDCMCWKLARVRGVTEYPSCKDRWEAVDSRWLLWLEGSHHFSQVLHWKILRGSARWPWRAPGLLPLKRQSQHGHRRLPSCFTRRWLHPPICLLTLEKLLPNVWQHCLDSYFYCAALILSKWTNIDQFVNRTAFSLVAVEQITYYDTI